jgi:PIN domain nuclease of toxin-antitoxin system
MRVLLDTCAVIFRAEGHAMTKASISAIDRAAATNNVLISPVSAWELGLLTRSDRSNRLELGMDPLAWFTRIMSEPGAAEAPLTFEIALASTRLPGDFHRDPADRFLVATARALDVPIVTRDEAIEAYAKAGHVKLIRC